VEADPVFYRATSSLPLAGGLRATRVVELAQNGETLTRRA